MSDLTIIIILAVVIIVISIIAAFGKAVEKPLPWSYCLLAGTMIIHAAIMSICFMTGLGPKSSIFILLGWLWFIWPIVLLIHPARSLRRWIIPSGIGFLLFMPSLIGIFVMTIWKFGNGFAP